MTKTLICDKSKISNMIYLFESYLPDRAFVYRSTETELFIHTRHDVSQLVNDN